MLAEAYADSLARISDCAGTGTAFARAASSCHVSQSTLSAGLAKLEDQLGTRRVERDRRFIGLTAEAPSYCPGPDRWSRPIVTSPPLPAKPPARYRGEARLGIIPAAAPVLGHLAERLQLDHPGLVLSFRSMTSETILRKIRTLELDAGLTYVDHDPLPNLISLPL